MHKNIILTIQQIIKSENNFIAEHSEEKILIIAGKKIAEFFLKNFKEKSILFVCGSGNNGNDGKFASKFLKSKIKHEIVQIPKKQIDYNLDKLKSKIYSHQIIVDCLFGTGLKRDLSFEHKRIIKLINNSKKKIISIDIPSGIDGNTGEDYGAFIRASITLCMGFFKPLHFLMPSKDACGEKVLLKLPLKPPKKDSPEIFVIEEKKILKKIPRFGNDVHKYTKGHVVIIGGEMAGASRMVAIASRKVGAGLSTILVLPKHLKYYAGSEPGTIISEFNIEKLQKKQVLVIGPGLGKDFDLKLIIQIISTFKGKIILDADAISNFKNYTEEFYKLASSKKFLAITPHAGEFKRVFKSTNDKILDSIFAGKKISNRVLLKGNDTVVSFPNGKVFVNDIKTNNLATAGSGDILCGLISGLVAQNMNFDLSILAAICIQNRLALNKKNVIAEDFLRNITKVMNTIKNNN